MISQSLYQLLIEAGKQWMHTEKVTHPSEQNSHFPKSTTELDQFLKPYVFVIHRPSRWGFYLDREYNHIIDVKSCQEPKNPVEVKRVHLCASSNLPPRVGSSDPKSFDTFWLY